MYESDVLKKEGWNEVKTVTEDLEKLEVLRLGLVMRD